MAHNKVTVDVEARFIDNVTVAAKKVDKSINDLSKKKSKVVLDAETEKANRSIDKTNKKLDQYGKQKPKATANLDDRASKGLDKLLDKTKRLANTVCDVAVKVHDNDALKELGRIEEKGRMIAGKTWTAAVKVKDMALAPLRTIERKLFSIKTLAAGVIGGMAANKYVKQPVQDYANYEDLVTQFGVLLGDQKKAKNRIDELTAFAGKTPFTRDEIYQSSRVLQTYTQGALATPDATGGLRMIGDIAAATGREYTQVATYMGQLYNEVKRGGESLGEPLAFLREMGALSAEQEQKIKDIAQGSGDIETKWKAIAGQFSSVYGMMRQMSNQTNNLLLGVKSFFKNNLYMKLGEGISESLKPFLVDFRTWRSQNKDLIAGWASDIKEFAAEASDKVLNVFRNMGRNAMKVMGSSEFKSADMFGKIGMLWEGVVSNPFAEWWDKVVLPWWENTAIKKLAKGANSFGTLVGNGLSGAIKAIFGIPADEIAGEGASVAANFVEGFKEGFDFSGVADAIVKGIGEVWKALPWWGKLLIGGSLAGKAASGIGNVAGGLVNIGQLAGGIGGAGAAGAGAGGAAAAGGLSGAAAKFATMLGAGGGSATLAGGLSGAQLALLGAGAAAGGVTAGVSVYSGAKDLNKGFGDKNLNAGSGAMGEAYKTSGASKLGGVAAGAAIGTMLGGPVGTLIGAGIGGVGGWLIGNKIKQDAAEGISSLGELQKAAKSSSEAADVLKERNAAAAKTIKSFFGDVKLTSAEVRSVVDNALGGMTERMSDFQSATANANNSVNNFDAKASVLKKLNWQASVGMKFNDEDKETYKTAIEEYIKSAEEVVENEHYKFTAAVEVLLEPDESKGIIESGNATFSKIQEELDSTETELTQKVKLALKDGTIDADESELIGKLQQKIASIKEKVASAQTDAEMEAVKIKFGSAAIDESSFAAMQKEIKEKTEASIANYDEALVASIAGVKLELKEGKISQEDYDKKIKELTKGYEANVGEVKAKAEGVQLDILGESDKMQDILGKDARDKLQSGLEASLKAGIKPINWTQEQAKKFLNVKTLTQSQTDALAKSLQGVADSASMDVSGVKIKGQKELASETREKIRGNLRPSLEDIGTFNSTARVNVTVTPSIKNPAWKNSLNLDPDDNFRGGIVGANIPGFSNGGQVRGGAQLAWLAEEGTPEMVIPLGIQRRKRGLQLWEKAGQMMGVPGFANGGIVGGNEDEGIRHQQSNGDAAGNQGVQVQVGGVTVEVNVNGGGETNIAQAIAEQGSEIAETISGILADALSGQFANTPTKGIA